MQSLSAGAWSQNGAMVCDMKMNRSAGSDKSWGRLQCYLLAGTVFWRIMMVLPAVMVVGAFFTRESFGSDCSEQDFGRGGLAQILVIGLIAVAMLWASAFIAPLKAAEQDRDLSVVRIRTEGLQWLVVATTGVGGTCLALAGTVNTCTWIGAGIMFVGFFWGLGGIGAVLLHCGLVQLRLIQVERREDQSGH